MKGALSAWFYSSSTRTETPRLTSRRMPGLGPALVSSSLGEKTGACCRARAMLSRFFWLPSAFLFETSGYPVTLLSQEEEKPLHPLSKTWSEMGSDIFWSSRCSIELDEIRKSFIFMRPHFCRRIRTASEHLKQLFYLQKNQTGAFSPPRQTQ